MKKLSALLLALLMVFSIATVALAADEDAPAEPATTSEEPAAEDGDAEDDGGFDIMSIPLWQAKFGLKVGKILLKLVKAVVKVLLALRILDEDQVTQMVINLFGLEGAEEAPVENPVE